MKKNIHRILLAACCCILPITNSVSASTTNKTEHLTNKNGVLTDASGRTVILNGLNHVNKNKSDGYLNVNDEELFKKFKSWGFNCIRYGIIWDGLEPEPGKINEAYLKEIDKRVKWAEENGIWLMLDMHQDLYGQAFSDGAPAWATLTNDAPHYKGNIWSEAYLISPAVQNAFDNFWKNTPATDGIGIQDHYINAWKVVADRYKNAPSVLGFDIMNEPFPGTQAQEVMGNLLTSAASMVYDMSGMMPSESEIMATLSSPYGKAEALSYVSSRSNYQKVLNGMQASVASFEQGALSDFYQKVRDAIRSVNSTQMIILEHSYFCNLGLKSSVKTPIDTNGKPDQLCIFAPHGYDLVTDSELVSSPASERVDVIFEALFESGKEKALPTIVGEWGAFYMGNNKYINPAKQIISHIESNLGGQTYWCYWDGIESQDYFPVVSRTYPMRTAGTLKTYQNDFENKQYTMQWDTDKEDLNQETIVYIPDHTKLNKSVLESTEFQISIQKAVNGNEAWLIIKPQQAGKQTLSLLYN